MNRICRKFTPTLPSLFTLSFLVLPAGLHAATTYIGGVFGNWGTDTNWSTGQIPGSADDVIIDSSALSVTVSTGFSVTRNAASLTVNSGDRLLLDNNSTLILNGPDLKIDGELAFASGGNPTNLNLAAPVTLSGSGVLSLSETNNNSNLRGSGSLTNGATIRGRGNLGFNELGLVNSAGGLIEANVPAATNPGALLFIDPNAAEGMTNRGTMQATSGGLLMLWGGGGGIFQNDNGLIQALGAGSEVQLAADASIIGGTFHTADGGLIRGNASQNYFFTDVTFDAGTEVRADNNSDFGVLGTITNNGRITIAAEGNSTDIELQGDTSFIGGGEIVLGTTNNNANVNGTGNLVNSAGHTIRGRGDLGYNTLGIVNNGLISADAVGGLLFLDPSATGNFDNNATLQALTGSVLMLSGGGGGTFANDGALIQAKGVGAEVQLTNFSRITGGTLHTESGGLIRGNASQNYFFTDVTFDNGTEVRADNNSDFGVLGTITNNGRITIAAEGNSTDIELQGDTSFIGGGEIVLGTTNNNANVNGTGNLVNSAGHTIRGRGDLGYNTLGIVNNGLISADAVGGLLFLDPSATGNFDNNATLQALTGSVLMLSGGGGGTFANDEALIQAKGVGAEVQLTNFSRITGGILHTESGGLIRGNASQNYFFTDVTFDNGTEVRADNNSDFRVLGNINNNGRITIAAGGNATDIELQGDTTFLGGGEIVLGEGNNNARVNGTGNLVNSSGHTIRGRGNVGFNTLGIVNDNLISADASGGLLILDPSLAGNFDNNDTLQALTGSVLMLTGGGGGTFANDGGLIQAKGAGSEVQLVSDARITGGSFHTEDGGLIRGNASQSYFFEDVAFDTGTQVRADNNSDFGVLGTITNNGRIMIAAGGNATNIALQGDTVFLGSGEVVLGIDSDLARVNGTGTLTNGTGHTIRGRGNLGFNTLGIFNASGANIIADAAGAPLYLDPLPGAGSFDNRGTLSSRNGGILQLTGFGGGTFDNLDGLISAGDGSQVQLLQGVSINAGTLISEGTGIFVLNESQTASISNADISSGLRIENNSTLNLSGSITHSGDLTINSGGNGTRLNISEVLELEGGGSISMRNGRSWIGGNGVLINRDHLISGAGNIGFNETAITNSAGGTIRADVTSDNLYLDPNSVLGFVNDGRLQASGGGTLHLSGSGGGEFTNSFSGIIEALDGGTITHSTGANLTNLSGGILSGGIYRAIDGGNGATLILPGENIGTNAANIQLSGANARMNQLTTLARNAGFLALTNGASLNTAVNFSQAVGGILNIGIEGKPDAPDLWSRFVTTGRAAFDGVLNVAVNLGETFTTAVGDTWKIFSTSVRTGQFSAVNFTSKGLAANQHLQVNYLDDGVEVEVVAAGRARAAATMTFKAWADAIPNLKNNDPQADPDLDGVSNLQEYAFAMDPTVPDTHLAPQPEIVSDGTDRYLAVVYHRPIGFATTSDLAYAVECSTDLKTWSRGEMAPELLEIGDLTEEVTVYRNEKLTGCEFLRVNVRLKADR